MPDETRFTDIINMSALGDKLREARERKNLTIGQVQKQTRIHSTVLMALEDGNCDSILNPAYVKSFLKKYSDFLNLDSARVLKEYRRLRPESETSLLNRAPAGENDKAEPSKLVPMIRFLAVCGLALTLIVFVGGRIVTHVKRQYIPRQVTSAKSKQAVARPGSEKKPRPSRAEVSKKGTDIAIPKNVQLKLLMKVNRDVFIKMRIDGRLLFERKLTRGTAEVFTADKSINIYAADGDSIELVLNGKALGSPGKGVLKDIEITRSGIKIK